MKGLRRNEDAMKNQSWYQKITSSFLNMAFKTVAEYYNTLYTKTLFQEVL